MDYDLIIRNGIVIDGMRMPRYRADVGVKDGKIRKIGRISAAGAKEIDASGCIVAPGFVDLHCHYDAQIHWDPYCTISGWHGVTSVTLGNCGFGFAPVKPQDRERSMLMMTRTEQIEFETMKEGMPWAWETFPEWMENLRRVTKGVNVMSLMPLSPLLVYVMGLEAARTRAATPEERKEMQRLTREALDAGACGFSLQRFGEFSVQCDYDGFPMPTDLMHDEDIYCLAEVLRERDQGFIQLTHAVAADIWHGGRERDHEVMEKLAEISGRPVLYNVIIVSPDDNPAMHEPEMEWLRDCSRRGLRIMGQGQCVRVWLDGTLERWNNYDSSAAWKEATLGTIEEKIKKMKDPDIRRRMRDEYAWTATFGIEGTPEHLTILEVPEDSPELKKYVGRIVGDIAKEEGKHPNDALLDICLAGDLKVKFRTKLVVSANADLVGPVMSDQLVLPGVSDGGAHSKFFTGGSFTTDYLTWLARDTNKITLEEAHYHLSYLPAQIAGFNDRGVLREGSPADIIVYDLDKLRRVPEWEFEVVHDLPANDWRVVQRAEGYRWIIVNGEITFEDSVCTNATPGVLLRADGGLGQEIPLAAE